MKNLIKLYTANDIEDFVKKLWGTPLFRESKYVSDWVEQFAGYPRVFAEMSEHEIEYPHFGTFFGLTYLRHYDDHVISDLYYLHEIVHAVLSRYGEEKTFTAWYRKVNETEFSASLETEANAYLEIPGLRSRSFTDQIWADRHIGSNLPKAEAKKLMRQERYRAMREPDPMDYCEQQIAAYARQNFEWANIWKLNVSLGDIRKPAYEHVESHMAEFRNDLNLDKHIEWLYSFGGDVAFPDQARLFSDVYWRNKLGYKKGY